MKIGIHDADVGQSRAKNKFPNLALMKISAWHRAGRYGRVVGTT